MKTYSFTVDMDFSNNGGDFIKSLKAEVDAENQEILFAEKINAKTCELHKNILCDLVVELNKVLEPVGVEFGNIRPSESNSHKYHEHMVRCRLHGGQSIYLHISAVHDKALSSTVQTTFSGDHVLKFYQEYNAENADFATLNRFGHKVMGIKDILDNSRLALKNYLRSKQ